MSPLREGDLRMFEESCRGSLRPFFSALLSLTLAALPPEVRGQELEVLAKDGDPVPNGAIDSVGTPVVSGGHVVFVADIDPSGASSTSALVAADGGPLVVLLREDYLLPAEGLELSNFGGSGPPPSVTPSGDAIFHADQRPIGGGPLGQGLFIHRRDLGTVASIVVDGDPDPQGNGNLFVDNLNRPALGGTDQIAFFAEVFNAVGGLGNGSGLYRSSGAGAVTRIVRTGQIPPLGSSFFDGFTWPSVNASGEVAFVGFLDSGPDGVYKGSGGALTTIALDGDEAVPGSTISGFSPVGGVPINDSGYVAFRADIEGLQDAIFLGNGGSLARLAYGGQIPDDGQPGDVPGNLRPNVALNNANQVVFTGTDVNAFTGVFRAEVGRLVAIAREGGHVPGTVSGTFESISAEFALNERGDVAFEAGFQAGGQLEYGIFFYSDATGLLPAIVQTGTPLAGGIVESFNLLGVFPTAFRSGGGSGLDRSGRVVFSFRLTNDVDGIGVFTPPPIFGDGFESGDTSGWTSAVP